MCSEVPNISAMIAVFSVAIQQGVGVGGSQAPVVNSW